MLRTLFARLFLWSVIAQFVALGTVLSLATYYLPDTETAISEAWRLYAHTAVIVYEKFGPSALDQFLAGTGEDTLLQLKLAAASQSEASCPVAPGADTLTIATRGLDGDYCLTVHASAGGLPESPGSRRLRMQILILLEVVACAGVSWLIAANLSRPIRELQAAAARLAAGDLSARVGSRFAGRKDETAELVREFDQMADRISELIQARQKLIGDISHEIKSPLARLSIALGLARRSAPAGLSPDLGRQLDRMQREVERVSALGSELLTLTKLDVAAGRAPSEPVDLGSLIERIVADALYEAQGRTEDLRLDLPDHVIVVPGDANLLRRAIENAVRNAIFYTPPGAAVTIRLSENVEDRVTVEVIDAGPGVPEEALAHLFEPFYRVDEARARETGGTGIGLAICERVVRLHGGHVGARRNIPSGLVITIILPAAMG